MDKVKKLRRYSRKDYTQLVDFPVEIVGRDGVVRRYSFEASVRLYQRRIASAASRYDDNEVVDAEVVHCRRRIEQLRKSYFHRYGWSGIARDDAAGGLAGEYAGEVAAFLRRFYGTHDEPRDLDVCWVAEQDHGQTYFVRRGQERSYVLYLFHFEHYGTCAGREAFFSLLRMVQQARGSEVEALVAFHHTADCGLVLTSTHDGSRQDAVELAEDAPEAHVFEEQRDDPYGVGMALLNAGEPDAALKRLQAAQVGSPWSRHVAVSTAVVADMLGQAEEAEVACRMGLHHFPGDPTLRYHLGLSLTRQYRIAEAMDAVGQGGELFGTALLRSLLLLARSRPRAASIELRRSQELDSRQDHEAEALVRNIRAMLRARTALLSTGVVAVVIGLVLTVAGVHGGTVLLGCAAAGLGISWLLARRLLLQVVSRERLERLRLLPPEGLGARGPRLDDVVN